jgi:hypothetical protein
MAIVLISLAVISRHIGSSGGQTLKTATASGH